MNEPPRLPHAQPVRNYHPKYRPDIDGLRALAILPVVMFHFYPHVVLGGYVGVDVFFVISGFLISRIIFQSLQDGAFSFLDFYAHRIKRIFPALLLVLAASLAFGWFALLPDEYRQLGKHMAASAGFVQNFILWQEAGYFDTESHLKPLLHLWSLAVEEQFYLIYPLLVWGAWRTRRNPLILLGALGLLSFGLNLYGIGRDAAATFFLPHTRYWELLAGGALAYHYHVGTDDTLAWLKGIVFHPRVTRQPPPQARQDALIRNAVSGLGCFLLLVSFFTLDRTTPFPGAWALLPVLGASFTILAGGSAWINARILAWRPLVFIGLISYPLYLWHWPLLSFARIMDEPPALALALPLSFALAWLTYLAIERPIRAGKPTLQKTLILCSLMAALGAGGYYAYSGNGLPARQPIKDLPAYTPENFEWDSLGLLNDVSCHTQIPLPKDVLCKIAKDAPPTVLLLGDSHSNALYPGLAEAMASEPGANVANLSLPGQLPFSGIESGLSGQSDEQSRKQNMLLFEQSLLFAETSPSVRTVIIASRWPLYLSGYFYASVHGGEPRNFLMTMPGRPDVTDRREMWRLAMRHTLARLSAQGKQVIFVLDVAELGFNPKTSCIEHRPLRFTAPHPRACGVPRAEFDERSRAYRELVTSILKDFPAVKTFDAAAPLCDAQMCWAMKDGTILYRDGDHLSVHGSRLVGRELARLLAPGH